MMRRGRETNNFVRKRLDSLEHNQTYYKTNRLNDQNC